MSRRILILVSCIILFAGRSYPAFAESHYAVVVSKETLADEGWLKVVEALEAKYAGSKRIVYEDSVNESRDGLSDAMPRYTCFVTKSADAGRQFVADVHVLTRALDRDPYTDTIWGILTGSDAANALAIAQRREPLKISRAASGTDFELGMVDEGKWYCELVAKKMVEKNAEGVIQQRSIEQDTTGALVEALNDYKPDLFLTSGHATERDWQIGFRYKNGYFRSKAGEMYGYDMQKKKIPISSSNPKAYMAIGNCLMGHIDGPDAMALGWMNSAGVHQMIGYTVNTWYGYAGWGCIDYFIEQPGRYTFSEAFFANHHALIHRLSTAFVDGDIAPAEPVAGRTPRYKYRPVVNQNGAAMKLTAKDGYGLRYDRDVVAFYGDPAWSVVMKAKPLRWKQELTQEDGIWTFAVTPLAGETSFDPVNENGAQRGYRPIVEILNKRVSDITIIEDGGLKPVVADDFILIPHPGKCDPDRIYKIVFKATTI